ncbi:MAG: pilus assembly protein TadG-related protein [Ilumatobacteraceae bacterium]
MSRAHPDDRGQATMLLLACVAFIAVVVVAAGAFGERLVARQRAQGAADAAALAGTTAGVVGAQRLAAANGATLVSFAEAGDEVTVVVEVRGERAMARATDGP